MAVWEVEWYLSNNPTQMSTKIFSTEASALAFKAQLELAMSVLELQNVSLVVLVEQHAVLA